MKYYSAIKAARYIMSRNGMTYFQARTLVDLAKPSRIFTYPEQEHKWFEFPEFSESDLDELVKKG